MGKAYTVYIQTENGETLGIEGGHSFDENFRELEKAVLDRQRVLNDRMATVEASRKPTTEELELAGAKEKPGQKPDMTIPVV